MSRTAQDVTLEVNAEQTAIACDADRIAQVISNLVSNASKYAPRSPIRVAIRNVDGKIQLSVSDDGPGVPPDRREAIFEPRVRLMDTESGRAKRGRGLGLFIARNIIEAHGGRIWAASGDQGGAVFTVELPVRTAS
jgi:signal transduction histidine kinase